MNIPSSLLRIAALLLLLVAVFTAPAVAADAQAEIRVLFAEYLRLHAAKEMLAWKDLFLPEALCVRTGADGRVEVYTNIREFAAGIAETAKTLQSQHETFEEVKIAVDGDAGTYATLYSLYHNGKKLQQGRAYFSLLRREGKWLIAALVWYKQDWKPSP